MEEKSEYIVTILKKLGEIDIAALTYGERDKKHAVAAFLAILDLIRDGVAAVESGETDGQTLKLCAGVMKGT